MNVVYGVYIAAYFITGLVMIDSQTPRRALVSFFFWPAFAAFYLWQCARWFVRSWETISE